MRRIILLTFFICASYQTIMAQTTTEKNMIHQPVLRHVVLFKFVDKASSSEVKKIEEAFRALPGKISLIKDFEWGVNNSPEKLNQGLTHCFFVSFGSAADRDAYLVHPAHKAFVELADPQIEKATVVDYWVHK